jgi:hypothetical protein
MWRSTGTPKVYQLRVGASPVVISVAIYPATCPPSHRSAGACLLVALSLDIWAYDHLFVCAGLSTLTIQLAHPSVDASPVLFFLTKSVKL